MIDRGIEIAGFLSQHGWDEAQQDAFEADFSPRRYARLTKADGARVILMDAAPDQKTPQFVAVAKILAQCGLSAPVLYAAHPPRGMVLLEDFGDRNFGMLIDDGADPAPLLHRAVEVLAQLHQRFTPDMAQALDLPVFDADLLSSQAALYLDTFFAMHADRDATPDERASFLEAWCKVLTCLDRLPASLLLRDFMPDNLMDLPDRAGASSVGLLDFQDAGTGCVAYDLASLTEVVRRDGMDAFQPELLAAYHALVKPSYSLPELSDACAVLAALRHTRILGIVVRLSLNGRQDKLAYLPRVQAHLARLLRAKSLAPVADWFSRFSPVELVA